VSVEHLAVPFDKSAQAACETAPLPLPFSAPLIACGADEAWACDVRTHGSEGSSAVLGEAPRGCDCRRDRAGARVHVFHSAARSQGAAKMEVGGGFGNAASKWRRPSRPPVEVEG